MEDNPFAEFFPEELPRPAPKWPHKCQNCGRFVRHSELIRWMLGEEYRVTARCDNCHGRVRVLPI